jgi:5-dehydro-2-deoxygluconokinase
VEGFVGFAIGRSIWGDPLKGFLDGSIERQDAARQVGDNYMRFVSVYQQAESATPA